MTALLYESISSNFTKDEKIDIDKSVLQNRELVYLFVRELALNSKTKTKKLFLYIRVMFEFGQPLLPYAYGIMVPLPPPIVSTLEQDREILNNKNYYPEIASIIETKMDTMILTDKQTQDLDFICYQLRNGSITVEKAVLKLRAGGFQELATLAFFIYMFTLQQSNAAFNIPLPHQDPIGWMTGKYDNRPKGMVPGPPSSRPIVDGGTPTFLEMMKLSFLVR